MTGKRSATNKVILYFITLKSSFVHAIVGVISLAPNAKLNQRKKVLACCFVRSLLVDEYFRNY